MLKKIHAKLGTMRKAVDWVVYPDQRNGQVIIQSDKRIAAFDPATGEGLLSASHNYAAFVHLTPLLGAKPIKVSQEVIAEVLAAQPKSGDAIGPGVYIA